jgi:hypothetical protein
MFRTLILFFLLLAIIAMACGFSLDLPPAPTPEPEVTDEIKVAVPEADEVRLRLSFGVGKLELSPGAEDALVSGTATYNISDFEPKVSTSNGEVEISQGEYQFKSLNLSQYKNEWMLKLGDTPLELIINAGAYEGNYEFGGLALTDLTIKDGAADVDLAFSEPNQTEMSVLRYETGASDVKLTGLANANFETMLFNGGAGNYHLDFSGDLQRDATVTVECGLSDLQLVIPEDFNAKVTVEGAAVNVNHSSGWAQNSNTYLQDSDGPTLTVVVKMNAGNVTITD